MVSKRLIVHDGSDPLTAPILEYLNTQYGIPRDHVRRVQLDSQTGEPQTIIVTLYVNEERTSYRGPDA